MKNNCRVLFDEMLDLGPFCTGGAGEGSKYFGVGGGRTREGLPDGSAWDALIRGAGKSGHVLKRNDVDAGSDSDASGPVLEEVGSRRIVPEGVHESRNRTTGGKNVKDDQKSDSPGHDRRDSGDFESCDEDTLHNQASSDEDGETKLGTERSGKNSETSRIESNEESDSSAWEHTLTEASQDASEEDASADVKDEIPGPVFERGDSRTSNNTQSEQSPSLSTSSSLPIDSNAESTHPTSVTSTTSNPPSTHPPPQPLTQEIRKPTTNQLPPYPYLYRLRAVILHYGSHDSGHFVTYRRVTPKSTEKSSKSNPTRSNPNDDDDDWFRISDDRVESVRDLEGEVYGHGSGYVYMMFYERCGDGVGGS